MKPEAVQLSPDLSGLTSAHAAVLLKQHGLNQMPAEREVPKWKRLLLELTHFFALMHRWTCLGEPPPSPASRNLCAFSAHQKKAPALRLSGCFTKEKERFN